MGVKASEGMRPVLCGTALGPCAAGVVSSAALLAVCGLFAVPATATMPANPERLLKADTCNAALEGIRQAARGSPLVSAEENRAILLAAVAQAERLCRQQIEKKPEK